MYSKSYLKVSLIVNFKTINKYYDEDIDSSLCCNFSDGKEILILNFSLSNIVIWTKNNQNMCDHVSTNPKRFSLFQLAGKIEDWKCIEVNILLNVVFFVFLLQIYRINSESDPSLFRIRLAWIGSYPIELNWMGWDVGFLIFSNH